MQNGLREMLGLPLNDSKAIKTSKNKRNKGYIENDEEDEVPDNPAYTITDQHLLDMKIFHEELTKRNWILNSNYEKDKASIEHGIQVIPLGVAVK